MHLIAGVIGAAPERERQTLLLDSLITASKSSPLPNTSICRGYFTPSAEVLCSSTRRSSSWKPFPHTTFPRK